MTPEKQVFEFIEDKGRKMDLAEYLTFLQTILDRVEIMIETVKDDLAAVQ